MRHAILLVVLILLTGCASTGGPTVSWQDALDAALLATDIFTAITFP